MELDEAEAAQAWSIPWHEWEATPRESRLRMTATVFARHVLDAMRQYDYNKDAEQQRKAAAERAKSRRKRH